jgi:RNA polymerase Rpb4.
MALGLSEFVSVKIVDILPNNIDELRAIVYPHLSNLDSELGKKILDVVGKYR